MKRQILKIYLIKYSRQGDLKKASGSERSAKLAEVAKTNKIMGVYIMTIQEIENILKGNFQDAEDKKYWEERLKKEKIRAETMKQNEIYFNKMFVYDR